jgi:autotransporter-associated beta strand protein
MSTLRTLRRHRRVLATVNLTAMVFWTLQSSAADFYKGTLNLGFETAGSWVENAAPGASDTIVFSNLTSVANFDLKLGTGTVAVGGLRFLNNLPGAMTIRPANNVSSTLAIGAGGIDAQLANQNMTFARTQGTGVMTVSLTAPQTWSIATSRTLAMDADLVTGGNAITIVGGGTTTLATVSGGGALNILGLPGGTGGVVTLKGNNGLAGLGAVTVGGGAQLNIDQNVAGQNKLGDAATLTLNRATLNLQGALGGTEVVGNVVLGAGRNEIKRSAGAGILAMNAVTRSSADAVLNVQIAGIATTDTSNNVNAILGSWGVIGFSDWAVSAASASDTSITALAAGSYTTQANPNSWAAGQKILLNATGAAANTADRTIANLKIASAVAVTVDLGAVNTLTLNDGSDSTGGILRNQNVATTFNNGFITAGVANDATADTLYVWNGANTMTMGSIIKNNGADPLAVVFTGNGSGSASTGVLALNSANTFTGGLVINAGTVNLGSAGVASDGATLGAGTVRNNGLLTINKTNIAHTIPNSISGVGALTIARGTVTFTGANTYSGDTTVTTGTFKAGAVGGSSPNSRMVLNAAGVLFDLDGHTSSVAALNGSVATATVDVDGATLTLTGGPVPLVAQSYSGNIIGAGGLEKNGTYSQVFAGSGALGYTGLTLVSNGLLQVNRPLSTSGVAVNGGTFTANFVGALPDTASIQLTGALATYNMNLTDVVGSLSGVRNARLNLGAGTTFTVSANAGSPMLGTIMGAGSVVKNGAGTLTLGGGNGYTGTTTINAGTLQFDASVAGLQQINDDSAVTIGAAGTLDLNGVSETLASLAGAGVVQLGGGTLTIAGGNSTVFSGSIYGPGNMVKRGTGGLTLSGFNPFAGNLEINGGTVTLNDSATHSALGDLSNVTVSGRGAAFSVLADETISTLSTANGSLVNIGVGATLVTSNAGNQSWNGASSGAGGLTKNGAGDLVITGRLAHAGTTTFNAGNVFAGAANRPTSNVLSDSSTLELGASTVLSFTNTSLNIRSFERVGGLSGSGVISLFSGTTNSNTTALVVGGNNANTTWGGTLTGNIVDTAFMKEGTGKLTMTGSHTYDGVFRVDAGEVEFTGGGRLDDLSFIAMGNSPGAKVSYNIGSNLEVVAYIAGGGRATGFAPFTLGNGVPNASSMGGNTIGGTGGEIAIGSTSTLQVNSTTTPRLFGGSITGAGTFSKAGTSVLDFSGSSSVAVLEVAGGTLRTAPYGASTGLGAPSTSGWGTFGSGTRLRMAGGILDLAGSTQTVGTLITSNGTNTVYLGAGTLNLAAANGTYTDTIVGNMNASAVNVTGGSWFLGRALAINGPTLSVAAGTSVSLEDGTSNNVLADTTRLVLNGTLQFGSSQTQGEALGSLSGSGVVELGTIGRTLSLTSNAATFFSGTVNGDASSTFALNGGRMTLNGAAVVNTTMRVGGGATLRLDPVAAPDYLRAGLVLAGGKIDLSGSGGVEDVTNTTILEGASAIRQLPGTSAISLGSITRASRGGSLLVTGQGATTTSVGNGTGILGGYAVFERSDWAVSDGVNPINALAFYDSAWTPGVNFDATFDENVDGDVDTVRFNQEAPVILTLVGPGALNSGGILVTPNVGLNDVEIGEDGNGWELTAGNDSGAYDLVVHQYNTQGALKISAYIGDHASSLPEGTSLTKVGSGMLIVTRDNAYSGGTYVWDGTLQVGDGGFEGNLGAGGVINNAAIVLNRGDQSLTLGGPISGSGSIRNVGLGAVVLNGNSTFTGRTTVEQGYLMVGSNNALGSAISGTSVLSGAVLQLDGANTIAEPILVRGGTLAGTGGDNVSGGMVTVRGDSFIASESFRNFRINGSVFSPDAATITFGSSGGLGAFGVVGDGTVVLAGDNVYGNTEIVAGTVRLGLNSAGGTLGRGAVHIAANASLVTDRSNSFLFIDNAISGEGDISANRNSVYLAGDLSQMTGRLNVLGNVANVQVYLGNHDFLPNGAPGFESINITGQNGGNSGVRFNQSNSVLTMASNLVMQPIADANVASNRLAYFVKNGLTTLNLTGRVAGGFADVGNNDDRSFFQVTGGMVRIISNSSAGTGLMGVTAGSPDQFAPFGGELSLNSGDGNTGRATSNWAYLELTGDADQTITANMTGGGSLDAGGIFIYNGTGTLTLNPKLTNVGNGNLVFNSRNQINRGTVVLQGGVAWRDDGYLSVGAGATLRIQDDERLNVAVMRDASLEILPGVKLTASGNLGQYFGGPITGGGMLALNPAGNTTVRLFNTMNDIAGGITLNRGTVQFVAPGSLGSGPLVIDTLAGNDAEDTLFQYISQDTALAVITNPITITGTDTVNTTRRRGFASYGAGPLELAGPVTLSVANYPLYLRGSYTGASGTSVPFAPWSMSTSIVSGRISGPAGVVKDDAGAWTLTNATNNFTGGITINNGRFEVNSLGALGTGAKTINLGAGGNAPHFVFNSSFTGGTMPANMEMNLSGTTGSIRIVNLGSGGLTIADPTWGVSGAGVKTLFLGRFDDTPGIVNTVQGVISNNSSTNTTALAKDGLSTWRLTGANTFTGTLTVNNGTLQLARVGGSTLASGIAVNVVNAFGRGAVLDVSSNETFNSFSGGVGSSVALNGITVSIGSANAAATFNGNISGTGNFTKLGTGVQTMGSASSNVGQTQLGQSTYTGVTTIVGGRIDTSTLANAGSPSGIGAASVAASNLKLSGAANVSDIGLRYIGTGPATTDRLLSISPSDSATRTNNSIWSSPAHVIGINDDAVVNFTNTGDIGFTAAGSTTLTLRGNESSALRDNVFSPRIVDNTLGGLTNVNKIEAGLWILNNTNTYSGLTTVSAGTLGVSASGALGVGNSNAVANGTTISGGAGVGVQMRNSATISGERLLITGDGGSLTAVSGANIWDGSIVLNSNNFRAATEAGSSIEMKGILSSDTNARAFTVLGNGTIILSAANTAQGATNAQGGTLKLDYSLSDTSKLADAVALTFGGTGLQTLAGTDDNNTQVSRQYALKGAILELAGGTHTEIVGSTAINAGASQIVRTAGSAVLRMNAITRAQGGTMNFGAANIAQTDTNNTNGILGGWATVGKTDWATSVASGAADTLITAFSGYANNSYSAGNNTDVTTFGSAAGSFTTNTIRFNQASGGTLTMSGTNSLQAGGILMTPASGAVTIAGGGGVILQNATSSTTAAALDAIIFQNYSASALLVDVVVGENVSGAGTQGLTKAGTGKVILAQNNTVRGNIYVTEGTLQIGNGGATGILGTGTPLFPQTGATLAFNTTNATEYNPGVINGGGAIWFMPGNGLTTLLDDDNGNFIGNLILDSGKIKIRGNNNALGGVRDAVTVGGAGILSAAGSTQSFGNLISFSQGATLMAEANGATNTAATFSGRLDFNNTTAAGFTITTQTNQALTLSGVIKGSAGFTKTGNGTLTLSAQNFFDGVGTLSGQIVVTGGLVNIGNARSLGSYGVGNETIIQSGATLDLRGQALNVADDASAAREIIQISGNGYLGFGALRNTTGTGTISSLHLLGDSLISSASRIDISGYDMDPTPGVSFTRPTLIGNGNSLTKIGVNDFDLIETLVSGVDKITIAEGEMRAETRAQFGLANNVTTTNPIGVGGDATPVNLYPNTLFTAASVSGGIEIVYGGQTPDRALTALMNPIVGARLDLNRQYGAHHTANIGAFGRSALSGGNLHTASYLELNSDTLPTVVTFWDGNINLTGLANGSNTFFNIEGGGAGTNLGDTVLGTQSPGGDQVVNPQSMLIIEGAITGSGGFAKIGSRELRLTGNNTYTGDTILSRQTGTNQPVDPNQANQVHTELFGTTLYGQGRLAGTANIILERKGTLRVDNTTSLNGTNVNGAATTNLGANLSNRINDSATIKLRDGYLVFDSGTTGVTETLGLVRSETGNSHIIINPTNGAGVNTTITLTQLQRVAGSALVLGSWDSTAVFGTSIPSGEDSVRFALTNSAGLNLVGAGSGTARKVAVGVFSGSAPMPTDDPYLYANAQAGLQYRNNLFFAGRHFTTLDGGYLRPLDDSEYYTDLANIAGATGQNLNVGEQALVLTADLNVNALRFGNLDDNLGDTPGGTIPGTSLVNWQQTTTSLVLDDSATLRVATGMILFANMGQGMNQDMQSYVNGGTIDFGASEGIISNINGFYRTQDAVMAGNAAFIRSNITGTVAPGSVGLTKTGFQEVFLDGENTYTGLTKVANGNLSVRHGMALGAGGTGNGLVIEGSGQYTIRGGINVGMVIGNPNLNVNREDIYVGQLSLDNQTVINNVDSVNRHYGNITFDNVDSAGQTGNNFLDARIVIGGNTTLILAGNMGGGNTPVTEDIYYVNPRQWTMDGSSNGNFIIQGSVGDKLDASGNAISIGAPVSNKPTGTVFSAVSTTATTSSVTVAVSNGSGLYANMPISGPGILPDTTIRSISGNTITLSQAASIPAGSTLSSASFANENNVLVSWIGGNDELNVQATQPWKAVGRIELMRGTLRYTGDGDFYDPATLALINASEAGNAFVGFQIGTSQYQNGPGNDSMVNFMFTKPGQSFGVNNWTLTTNGNTNNGAIQFGSEAESGVVRFGPTDVTTQSTLALGRDARIYANAGGTVSLFSRTTGGSVSKIGRGLVTMYGNNAGVSSTATWLISGGTLALDYTKNNQARTAASGTFNVNGGALRIYGSAIATTTESFSNTNNNNLQIRAGGTEISVTGQSGQTTTLNIGRRVSTTDGAVLNRFTGSAVNFVEESNGGTASIVLLSKSTNWVQNTVLPWATYGTVQRTADDFVMIDGGAANSLAAFRRALDEEVNDLSSVTTLLHTGADLSENNGAGYYGTLGSNLTLNTLHFDAAADSIVNLGGRTLTMTSNGIIGGALMVASNVGRANKTISNGTLTTVENGELLIHNYGSGALNISAVIGVAGSAPGFVTIAGPSVTDADTLANWSAATTGQVILSADNSGSDKATIWNLVGSVLSISNENQLGRVTLAATTNNALYLNGGALRWTGDSVDLNTERNFTFGGNGGVIDVVKGDSVFNITGDILTENNYLFVNGSAVNHTGGDLVKMGAGTLALTGGTDGSNGSFAGMIDVREGTLRILANNTATANTQTLTTFGTNRSFTDSTIFRDGTNLELFYGSAAGGVEWRTEEWMRFEGNNMLSFGQTPVTGVTNRTTHINGVIDVQGALTVDVPVSMTARFNQSSGGYLMGTGNITKTGQGVLEFRDNNVLWTGGLTVAEGTMRLISTGLPAGAGTIPITLGSASQQGIADLQLFSEQGIAGMDYEVFQDVNVVYNPLQTKRISFGADAAAGNNGYVHGDVTVGDNLGLYVFQGGRFNGGSFNSLVFSGDFKDDLVNNRSGNIVVHADDNNSGTANNQQVGGGIGYIVFRGNNSAWTGDVTVGLNQSWDQDEITVLRLENNNALTAANDVSLNGSSKLQVAGGNVTIGSLITNNATATGLLGGTNDGTGNFQGVGGSSAWVENGSATPGKVTIKQTTPSRYEALWDATFQDGQPMSSLVNNNLAVGGSLSVVKDGAGWATMTLDNHYTGTTEVKAGILQVGRNGQGDTGAARAANAPGTTVGIGAYLAGTGYVQGSSVINGFLTPGDLGGEGMGSLTFNGDLLFGSGSVTTFQLQQPSFTAYDMLTAADLSNVQTLYGNALVDPITSVQHDQVVINGNATIAAGAVFDVVLNGYTPRSGDIFALLDWDSVSSSINVGPNLRSGGESGLGLNLPILGDQFRWNVSQFVTLGILQVVEIALAGAPPNITTQPQSQTVNPGTTVTFSVVAAGSSATYQWRKNHTNINGATNRTLVLTNVQESAEGVYDVIVTNDNGTVGSQDATLSVNDPIIITAQPQTQLVEDGNSAEFSVVVTGTAPISYQWQRNGVDVPGATDSVYALTASGATLGTYRCVITNPVGSVTSANAALSIPNVGPVQVITQPVSQMVAEGAPVSFTVAGNGQPTVTYQWKKNGANVAGATSSTLNIAAATTTLAGTYTCVLSNTYLGVKYTATSSPVQLGVVKGGDKNLVLAYGTKTTFTATAAPTGLQYQWRQDGVNVPGATSSSYTITSLNTSHTGVYTCAVTGLGGTAISGATTLTVFDRGPTLLIFPNSALPPAIVSGSYSYQVPVATASYQTPTSYKATGLPAGLTINAVTGLISGKPTLSKATPFLITITASNSKGSVSVPVQLTVTSLPGNHIGTYVGVLPRQAVLNANLGGRIDMTTTLKGTYSGKFVLGTVTSAFKGILNADVNNQRYANGTATILRKGKSSLVVSFTLDRDTNFLIDGSITDGTDTLNFNGWRKIWSKTAPASVFAGTVAPIGNFTFGLNIPDSKQGTVDHDDIPQGTGYGSFTVNPTTAALTVAGKLADGTAYTSATFLGPDGQVAVFKTLYKAPSLGSIVGSMAVVADVVPEANTLGGTINWWRPASTNPKERIYRLGFAPMDLTVVGARYVNPIAPSLILGLDSNALAPDNAMISFAEAYIDVPGPTPDVTLTVGLKNKITMPLAGGPLNPRKTTLSVVAAKGTMTGTFTLVDPDPMDLTATKFITRKVTFQGQIVRDALGDKAFGYFLLPKLPIDPGETSVNTRIFSGQVILEAVPPPAPPPEP